MSRTPMEFFETLCTIPHVSGNEKALADFVEQLARSKGYAVRRDAMHNLVVVRPASPGCEAAETFMLQGHLDMVAAAKEGVCHDFDKDPIRLVRDGKILRAAGTTLGADDGVAVAYMLAILEDDTIVAPRLECVFTVQEEAGLIGVQHFDFSGLQATKMLNLDAGPEGVLLVTNAGGCRIEIKRELPRQTVCGKVWEITIGGLIAGNSVAGAQKQQANALILAAVAADTLRQHGARLVSLAGGEKSNMLPESAKLTVAMEADPTAVLEALKADLLATWSTAEPNLTLTWAEAQAQQMLEEAASSAVIDILMQLPQGIISMSAAFAGLVETSANVGVCKTDADGLTIGYSLRSSAELRKHMVLRQVTRLAETNGAEVNVSGNYPGWNYEPVSPLRELCIEVYRQQYGEDPSVEGVHAGLECGVFKAAMPHLDIIATGPLYKQMHTADEWLDMESFERTYRFIVALLKKLSA